MIGIPLGLMYANAGEWLIHKYILHGAGRKRKSVWSFHWHDHHKKARKNNHIDEGYGRPVWSGWTSQSKEAVALVSLTAVHLPLLPVAPFFTGTVVYAAVNYYRVHKRAHLDAQWARENLPWHYDHHMGADQDKNWCVTRPWFDWLMGTRVPFVGTAAEERAERRRHKRTARSRQKEHVSVVA